MPTHEHALVVGKFAPLHRGHQLLLDLASAVAEQLTVIVWSNPDFPDMPSEVRAGWVRALYPNARVLAPRDAPDNAEPDHVHREYVAATLRTHRFRPDVVLTSEDYGPGFAAHLGVRLISVDPAREALPISGSAIRADVHAHRHMLDPHVYAYFVDKVVLLGAESTGKSTLAARLADELEIVHVDEIGRYHDEARGGVLDLDDYVAIAQQHRATEEAAAHWANRWLIVDTNAMTTMFFSHYYNRESRPELRALADECRTRYRHVFVCDDDIPFEQDGWRDNEAWRARMQGMVLHDLAVRGIPYTVVHGTLDERVAQVKAVLAGAASTASNRPVASCGPRPVTQSTMQEEQR